MLTQDSFSHSYVSEDFSIMECYTLSTGKYRRFEGMFSLHLR
jgi:hypothetical protein